MRAYFLKVIMSCGRSWGYLIAEERHVLQVYAEAAITEEAVSLAAGMFFFSFSNFF